MSARKQKIDAFISIIWRDSEDGPTWASEKEVHEFADQECLVESRGWLVRKTKKFVVIAADRSLSGNNPGELGRICKIPVRMIVSQETLHVTSITPNPSPNPSTPSGEPRS